MNLKSCPFCGSSATIYMQQYNTLSGRQKSYIIECDNGKCGCMYGTNMSLTQDEVVKRWNKRSDKK